MKAIFKTQPNESRVANNRKENKFYYQYEVYDTAFNTICTLRLYATQSRHYACFWLFAPDYRSGGGYASGYGYHRASAAAENAFNQAGIFLSESISGVGDSAIQNALKAIARAASGKRKFIIKTAHA